MSPMDKGDARFLRQGLEFTAEDPLWFRFSREFFMPRCGATVDENSVPPWTRGDFRGIFERGNKPTPVLRTTPLTEGIFRGDKS